MMRRTKEEAEITKRNILAAALDEFSRKGYKATRMEDIAKHADVTTGAIYHHFGGKSELYIALVEISEVQLNQVAQQIVEEGGTPASILRRLLVRMFEYIEEDEKYRAVLELFLNKTEISSELDIFNEKILAGRRSLAQFLSNLIQDGIAEGEFHSNFSPENIRVALVGFMNGMVLIWIQDPEYFSIKEDAEKLVDLFLSSILTGG